MRYRRENGKQEVNQGGAGNQTRPGNDQKSDDKTSGRCMARMNMNTRQSRQKIINTARALQNNKQNPKTWHMAWVPQILTFLFSRNNSSCRLWWYSNILHLMLQWQACSFLDQFPIPYTNIICIILPCFHSSRNTPPRPAAILVFFVVYEIYRVLIYPLSLLADINTFRVVKMTSGLW